MIEGTLPDMAKLTNLRFINIGSNNLDGTLPEALGNLPHLTTVSLGGNDFSGDIPASFGKLSNLEFFLLSDTKLNTWNAPAKFFEDNPAMSNPITKNQFQWDGKP